MKDIRLHKLTLRNFQGEEHFVFEPEGHDCNVYGINKAGKTRLASAFTWLLFNKDSSDRADFEIKNKDATGETEHGLDHIVEGVLSIDEEPITLKKVYHEKWTKPRGRAQAILSGHTTDYFIDGVPVQEKEYKAKIAEISGDETTFRLITHPLVFAQLHWKKQREILLEVCGDLTDQEVIDSNAQLESLPEILGKKTLDQYRDILTSRKTEINKAIEKIPVRIDEVKRGMPETSKLNQKNLEKSLVDIDKDINEIKLKIQGAETTGNLAKLLKELAQIEAKISSLETRHHVSYMEESNKFYEILSEAKIELRKHKDILTHVEEEIKRKEESCRGIDEQIKILRSDWHTTDNLTFTDDIAEVNYNITVKCYACGQPLPADKVKESRDKALAAFNLDKAKTLAEIEQKGKEKKEHKETLETEIEKLEKEKLIHEAAIKKFDQDIVTLTAKYEAAKENAEERTHIPGLAQLKAEYQDIEVKIQAEKENRAESTESLKRDLTVLESNRETIRESLDMFKSREQGEKRTKELKAEEKTLASEFERIESELFLTDLFIKTKVNLLTDKINHRFEFTRFKLFNVLVNGGIEPTCEITVDGIGYNSGLNSAARIQSGMDIIRTLQNYYGIHAPVIIDNRESTIDIPSMSCQVISLIVSREDKALRIEIDREKVEV